MNAVTNLSETLEVLKAISDLREQGRPMALATIVSVTGSTYRRPGARFLVPDSGVTVGNLSGGCLEGEVEQLGREVMSDERSRLQLYDLTADDEAIWGWGLGCNGAIEVFIEPAQRAAEVADALRSAIEDERGVAVVTVIESELDGVEVGARLLVYGDGERASGTGRSAVDEALGELGAEALAAGRTEAFPVVLEGGRLRVFVESVRPPLRLLVCGAGHDAIPVVELATSLGWRTVVVDDREALLDRARFPGANDFTRCDPAAAAQATRADDRSYALVMSHNYLRDRDYLKSFLGSEVAYIGMLGPRARLERLLTDLAGEGIRPAAAQLGKVHGPAGLDLAGEGPEEIAVAIVGEVLAVSRQRAGGFLRARAGSIHESLEAVDL
jgi:xanthine dehydrogenase accessory factor